MNKRGPTTPLYCALLAILAVASLSFSAQCRTWRVTIDGDGDAPTIQAAIDSAAEGDEVLVGPGTYTWTNQGSGAEAGFIRFLGGQEGITLRSELGPENTILDAEYHSRVIYVHAYNRITVDGFTIMHGVAPSFGDFVGGGFFTHIAREVVRNCIFVENKANYGGGISCVVNDGFIRVEGCTFVDNEAVIGGGALLLANGSGTCYVSDCLIRNNKAGSRGGGIYQSDCNSVIERCVISGNEAGSEGSGFCESAGKTAVISACTFSRNGAANSVVYAKGGSVLSLERLIVAFNVSNALGADATSTVSVACCDIFGNLGGDAIPAGFIKKGTNLSVDPLFCGAAGSENYYLRSDSPCLPENQDFDEICLPMGACPVACGAVSVERTTWGSIKSIFR
ncbi:MAG: right-handed parallel beta-helix repeat-containing protein [Candidatus Krumholzibacteriia bacterium]